MQIAFFTTLPKILSSFIGHRCLSTFAAFIIAHVSFNFLVR